MSTPSHIKPQWIPFVARLQSVAHRQNGHAVVTISVMVDRQGMPLAWTEPKMTKMEPMSRTEAIVEVLRQNPELLEALSNMNTPP